MIFAIIILLTALLLSSVAAVYSVTGLIAIFPGSVLAIIIMGGTLEVSKIVGTVWLHKYWHRASIQFKLYLVPAIAVLMVITSMGIFGYLSASHVSQTASVGDVTAQVQIFDEKIATERSNIEANKKALIQMNSQVDQLLGRTTDDNGARKSVQVRKSQAKERNSLNAAIIKSQENIVAIQAERVPIASQSRKAIAEVGPILYIAALIYGDNPDANLLERAVRWVIILLVFVFDPLAIVLILAASQTFAWVQEDKKSQLVSSIEASQTDAEFIEALGEIPEIEELSIEEDAGVKQFFKNGRGIARAIDAGALHNLITAINAMPQWKAWSELDSHEGKIVAPIPPVALVDTRSDFGRQFPPNPAIGDTFLVTLFLPHDLYKWNGKDWIVIDKTTTDRYAYDTEYIKYLIEQLQKGEYDVEMLSQTEQEQIMQYLGEKK